MTYHACFGIDEVSLITLKILLQGAMELVQIATAYFITKCDGQLLQIATAFSFIPKCDTVYCKLRQVLQSAMIITNCDRYYKVRWLFQLAAVHRIFCGTQS